MSTKTICRAKVALVLGAMASLGATSLSQGWTATRLHSTESTATSVDGGEIGGYTGFNAVDEQAALWMLAGTYANLHPVGAERSAIYEVEGGRQVGIASFAGQSHAASWNGTAASFFDLHPPGATLSSAFCLDGDRTGGGASIDGVFGATIWPSVGTSHVRLHDPSMASSRVSALEGPLAGGTQYTGFNLLAALWIDGQRGWRDLSIVGYSNYVSSIHADQQVGATNPSTNGWDRPCIWTGNAASANSFSYFGKLNDTFAGQQCGERLFNESNYHARVWRGTQASEIDLHSYLTGYSHSFANGIWDDGEQFTYVVGRARLGNGTSHAYMWKSANILTSVPNALNVITGIVIGGNLQSLENRDNEYLELRPGPVFSGLQSPIQIILDGTAPTQTPARVSLSIESRGTSTNVTQVIEFYDFSQARFERVGSSQLESVDSVRRIDVAINAARFLENGTGKMTARISYRSSGPSVVYPWEVRIDKIWWHMVAQ